MSTSSDNRSHFSSNSSLPPSHPYYRVIITPYHIVREVKTETGEGQLCKQEPPPTPALAQIPLFDDRLTSVKVEDEAIDIEVKSSSPETAPHSRAPISHPQDPHRLDCTQRSGMRLFIRKSNRRVLRNTERRHEHDGIDTPLSCVRARGQVMSREGQLRTDSAFYRHRSGHVTSHRHAEGREMRDAFDDGKYYNRFDEGVDVPYMPDSLLKEHAEVIIRLRNFAPLAHVRPVPMQDRRNRRELEEGRRVPKVAIDST